MTIYLDTSAAAKLLIEEAESAALSAYLDGRATESIVSSFLLETELRRVAVRLDVRQSNVSALLARVSLVEPHRTLFYEAGVLPGPNLRSLDALHLATAIRIEADVVVGYDARLLEAADLLGLMTASPA